MNNSGYPVSDAVIQNNSTDFGISVRQAKGPVYAQADVNRPTFDDKNSLGIVGLAPRYTTIPYLLPDTTVFEPLKDDMPIVNGTFTGSDGSGEQPKTFCPCPANPALTQRGTMKCYIDRFFARKRPYADPADSITPAVILADYKWQESNQFALELGNGIVFDISRRNNPNLIAQDMPIMGKSSTEEDGWRSIGFIIALLLGSLAFFSIGYILISNWP